MREIERCMGESPGKMFNCILTKGHSGQHFAPLDPEVVGVRWDRKMKSWIRR